MKTFLLLMVTALLAVSFSAECCETVRVTVVTAEKHPRGGAPIFIVQITNVAKQPVKLIDVLKRNDLRDTYAKLSVRSNGLPVDVPVAISDPGPIADEDYVVLSPGQKITFKHRGEPFSLASLPVGTYSATLQLTMPDLSRVVQSNSVSFAVIP